MTNLDREMERLRNIRNLAIATLAYSAEEEIDYDWDEEPFVWGARLVYTCGDGQQYVGEDFDEAIEHQIWWLQQEVNENDV